jgi:hypothetical protein
MAAIPGKKLARHLLNEVWCIPIIPASREAGKIGGSQYMWAQAKMRDPIRKIK